MRLNNYPLTPKISNRNPVFKTTCNFEDVSNKNKPFSRKPLNQIQQTSLGNSKISQNQLENSICEKSILDTQSVVSSGHSARQPKFNRTSKINFLSPKSKQKQLKGSFSPQVFFGSQSMILNAQNKGNKKNLNVLINQKDQILSQSSVDQNQSYLQKSISSNNLFRRNNKTRNMILSKFAQNSKRSKQKQLKNKLQTSIHTSYLETQKEERKRLQQINSEIVKKNNELQVQCQRLSKKTSDLQKQNDQYKSQTAQLKKRIQQLITSKGVNNNQPQKIVSSASQGVESAKTLLNKNRLGAQTQIVEKIQKCKECEQKQKSNQKQMNYFQNVLRKKQTQLVGLRKKQENSKRQNGQNTKTLSDLKYQVNQLLNKQKINYDNQIKFQECINMLKQQVAKLQDELRYLKIQNSVLLKIKNQHLKLKIDIIKIEDQRDYFKMKVIEIHKKNATPNLNKTKSLSEKYIKQRSEIQRKSLNTTTVSKKFYLDSTETEQLDGYNSQLERRRKSKLNSMNIIHQKPKEDQNKALKYKFNECQIFAAGNNYNDTLFDLTSQQSQNSY